MTGKDIVVALDGSERSMVATRWAIENGGVIGDRVVLVHAFGLEAAAGSDTDLRTATESVHRTLATAWLRRVIDDLAPVRIPTRLEVLEGDLGAVLRRYVADADALIVLGMGQDVLHDLEGVQVPVLLVPAPAGGPVPEAVETDEATSRPVAARA